MIGYVQAGPMRDNVVIQSKSSGWRTRGTNDVTVSPRLKT